MRHLHLVSSTVPIDMAALLLEDYVNTILEDELHLSPFELGPTLQDLYDLEVNAQENDPNEEAVNLIFPESMILQADIASEAVPTSVYTPTLPPIPKLEEEDKLDLRCYEEGFPPSDSEDERGEQSMAIISDYACVVVENHFVLDNPEVPGQGCKSCQYHREQTGDPNASCALCYMKMSFSFIYSPVSEDESSPLEEDHPSPPDFTNDTPLQVRRPTPVRPSGERRAAVYKIEDLLQDVGGNEPLNLSLKRPRN
ncbi:early E1A 13s [Human adenovirus D8]|uniref:Early E1A protein n=1 Tax=Human adenovirus D serotype 8 TaxID=31545 RepID=A0A0U5ADL2_ADE08|nr:early E1A 13S [Human adenovirus D8]UKB92891.1 early E1A 13S [Human adenovirus sp.]BBE52297.1 early E1A 13S [Human mastadenovirus D]ANW60736.1 early E1A 13s [Human adenovirus D8]ANW61294.1 early E1A 13s [Human adenovirus D8]